ncbi:MAG TPA: hypothetical protein VMT58_02955, partial [Candidatus Binataceae bacterium]|nr:hypothetical protein [Candidatus Binataceae bacterium]
MTPNQLLLGAIVAVLAIVVFVPIIRRIVRIVFRIAIVIIPLAAAAGGIAMIMNNETIFEEPGASQRIIRFLTMDSAVASKSGSGTIGCDMKEPPVELQQPSAPGRKRHHHAKTVKAAPPTGSVMPSATPTPDDTYPELIIRGYPGLSRQKLFDLARETVESLGGWKIVSANPATGTLDCVYTSRILKLEDDVRITVDPNGEIGVCSRS